MANVAVLIDGDNVSPKWIENVLNEASKLGTLALKRVYGDFSSPHSQPWRDLCAHSAIHPIQQYPNTKGKNASDIALVIDAMDLLHTQRYESFCLISSDSDFSRLATRLRENGVEVWGFGERKTPQAFVQACSKFIYVEILSESNDPETATDNAKQLLTLDKALKELLKEAVDSSTDEEGWAHLGSIGQTLSKRMPDFDSRNYGFAKLSDLLRATSLFEIAKPAGKGHLMARLKPIKPRKKPPQKTA